jgi:ABC-type bacteriocin/lantibiotic exporter with double-glycine peptidase domain
MLDAPRSRQFRTNDCGINDAGVALAYYGINEREMQLIDLAGLPEDGLETVDLVNLLKRFENRGITLDAGTMTLDDIRGAIDDGYPVILAIQAYADDPDQVYTDDWEDGHYVVAIGYDEERFIFQDSSSWERTFLTNLELLDRWHDSDSGQQLRNWGCIVKGIPQFSSDAIVHME